MLREEEYWFWHCSLIRVGVVIRNRLKEGLGSPEGIYRASKEAVEGILGPFHSECTVERVWEELERSRREEAVHRGHAHMKELGIRLVTAEEAEVPKGLLTLPDCPPGLFVKGKLPVSGEPAAAVVGSRECSYYGRNTAKSIGRTLAEAGVQVISGLARGIDAAGPAGEPVAGGRSLGASGFRPGTGVPQGNNGP